MRKTEKTIAGQTKVVLEVSVFDDDDIEERMESSFPQRWADVNDKLIEELRK